MQNGDRTDCATTSLSHRFPLKYIDWRCHYILNTYKHILQLTTVQQQSQHAAERNRTEF